MQNTILTLDQISDGGYYLYKEKHGMTALVKVIKKEFQDGWHGFKVMVKRVLHSPWEVSRGVVFEVGIDLTYNCYPSSWHFEEGMTLIKGRPSQCENRPQNNPTQKRATDKDLGRESAL